MKSFIPVATIALLLSAAAAPAIAVPAETAASAKSSLSMIPRLRSLHLDQAEQSMNPANELPTSLLSSTPRLRSLRLHDRMPIQPVVMASQSGRNGFLSALKLDAFTTSSDLDGFPATYRVKLTIPATAGRSLQAIKIMQEQNVDTVSFDPRETQAMLASGQTAPLASIGGAETPGEATVVFNPPIVPGQIVTIDVPVKANPTADGIYLFGVTAFPEGEDVQSQFLGFGRLHLNDR